MTVALLYHVKTKLPRERQFEKSLSFVATELSCYFISHRELFASPGAAPREHGSALFGAHALSKPVRSGAFAFLWLVCSLSSHTMNYKVMPTYYTINRRKSRRCGPTT